MNEREKLLKKVQMYSFACLEAGMFLDTHPNNKQALDYLKKCTDLYNKVREEYTEKFGMLHATDLKDEATSWDWIKGPWPWMNESEGDK